MVLPYNDNRFVMSMKYASKWYVTLHEYRSGSLFNLSLKAWIRTIKSRALFYVFKNRCWFWFSTRCHSRHFSVKSSMVLPYNDNRFVMSMKYASKWYVTLHEYRSGSLIYLSLKAWIRTIKSRALFYVFKNRCLIWLSTRCHSRHFSVKSSMVLPYNDNGFVMSMKYASKWYVTLHEYRSGSLIYLSLNSNN